MRRSVRIVVAFALVLTGRAWGQSGVLEEIVVTARRTEESLQEIPVAVTVVSSESIGDNVLRDVGDLSRVTPSLNFSQSPGQGINPIIAIRGQVQNDPSVLTLDPSVGVYLDDVYLGRSPGSLFELFDVERVEVLKGPQGTLYGRNTTGGAIRVIPKKADPGGGWSGSFRGGLGNHEDRIAEGAVNVPALDNLAFRLSYSFRAIDGWGKQLRTDPADPSRIIDIREVHDRESHSGRLNGIWNATDALTLDVGIDTNEQESNGSTTYESSGDFPVQPVPGGPITEFVRASDDFYTFASDVPTQVDADTRGFYAKAEYDFWGLTAKAIHARRNLKYLFRIDPDGTAARGVDITTKQDVDQDSTEIQLHGDFEPPWGAGVRFVAGLYDFSEDGHDLTDLFASEVVVAALGVPLPIASSGPPGSIPLVDQRDGTAFIQHESRSAFFQLTYDFTDWLGATAGIRYIEDSKRLKRSVLDFGLGNQVPGFGQGQPLPGRTPFCLFDPSAKGVTSDGTNCVFDRTDEFSYVTYTGGLDWRPADDLLVYAKTSRGARSGGQQVRGADSETLAPFDPEFVQDVEVGMKGDFLDRRLRTNLALYRTSYTDFQFSDVVRVSTVVQNVGDARIYGVELESVLLVTDSLTLNASGNYTDFKYLDKAPQFPGPADLTPPPDQTLIPVYTPRWQLNGSLGYKEPVSFGTLGGTIGYAWKSEQALDIDRAAVRANPNRRQEAFGLLQANAFVHWEPYGLRFGVFAANLLDEKYKVNVVPALTQSDPAIGGLITTGAPRLFGAELVWMFG